MIGRTPLLTERSISLNEIEINPDAQFFHVKLPDAHVDASGTVTLYRPNASSMDRSFKLIAGCADIPVKELVPGHYTTVIEWTFGNEEYRVDRAIEVGGAR
jgi:hypothetical protein